MFEKFTGPKKYQGKLTQRDQPNAFSKVAGRASNKSRNSTSSGTSSINSIAPIDLSANFFAKDDVPPARSPEASTAVDVDAVDDTRIGGKTGFFGAASKGYEVPIDQQSSSRHSSDSDRSPTMLSPRQLQDTPSLGSSNRDGSSSGSGSRSAKTVSFAGQPAEYEDHEMAAMPALHQKLSNKSDSYFFDNDYDMADVSRTIPFPASTPNEEDERSNYDEAEDGAAAFDPFEDYYGRPSCDQGRVAFEQAPAYSNVASTPLPPVSEKSPLRFEAGHHHAKEEEEEEGLAKDEETLLTSEKTARVSLSAAAIPRMESSEKSKDRFSSAYRHSILTDQLAAMTYAAKPQSSLHSKNSMREKKHFDDDSYAGLALHQKGLRNVKRWYGHWSTRKIIITIVASILACLVIIGIVLGIYFAKKNNDATDGLTPTWRPAQGSTWNIQLQNPITSAPNSAAYVYDIDLFDNNATTIAMLHQMGRRVICYFSAGTYENWRPDASKFPQSALGNAVSGWAGENWLDVRNKDVRAIMEARIDLAVQKGCDGVDPDNVNVYSQTDSGFPLTVQNGVDFMNTMAIYAHTSSIAIGLKNAPELINGTINNLDWELSESCATYNECELYQPFIQAGKPVFHIEYSDGMNATILKQACTSPGTHGFSTLLKRSKLDSWNVACPLGDTSGFYGKDGTM